VRSYLNRKKLGMKLCGKCEELEAWLKWQSAPWPGLITMKPWVQITVLRKTERERDKHLWKTLVSRESQI
jgi:hypothetical protein